MSSKGKVEIHLRNSTVGILSAGSIKDINTISANASSLALKGRDDIANAFKALTEAIAESSELSSEERAEVLDNLEEVTRQAALPEKERLKSAVIKSILAGIATTVGAAGGLAEVWSTWSNSIRSFFNL